MDTAELEAQMEAEREIEARLEIDALTIHQRMLGILGELPAIGKDAFNEQQKFHYRSHDEVLNALNPLLAKWGVLIVPRVLKRTTSERATSRGSTMYEVNLHVSYRFYGAGGDYLDASAWGEGTDMGDKSTNKAMTMAFKNVLAQAFAISTAELSDADATSPEETTRGGSAATTSTRPQTEAAAQGRGRQGRAREFDPGRDLVPGAIKVVSEEDATALRLAQRDLFPDGDWAAVESFLVLSLFEKPYDELTGAQKREFYTRLANAVARTNELAGPGDFPPPTIDHVTAGYAWAFKGVALALSGDVTPSEGEGDAEPTTEAPELELGDEA